MVEKLTKKKKSLMYEPKKKTEKKIHKHIFWLWSKKEFWLSLSRTLGTLCSIQFFPNPKKKVNIKWIYLTNQANTISNQRNAHSRGQKWFGFSCFLLLEIIIIKGFFFWESEQKNKKVRDSSYAINIYSFFFFFLLNLFGIGIFVYVRFILFFFWCFGKRTKQGCMELLGC